MVSNLSPDKKEKMIAGYYVMPKYRQQLLSYLNDHSGIISPNIVFEICIQLVHALKAVHEAGRTYNDLKQSNVMIDLSESKP